MGKIGRAVERVNDPFIGRRAVAHDSLLFGQDLVIGADLLDAFDDGLLGETIRIGHEIDRVLVLDLES